MGENYISKTITMLAFLSASVAQQALGQTTDNFNDGNFTVDPIWSGTTSHFIVDGSQRLQLMAPTIALGGGSSFLSLPFSIPQNHNATWEFFIHQNFSGSGGSFGRVYLMTNSENLNQSLNGYFLQFGEVGTADRIELFRQTGTTPTTVCRTISPNISAAFAVRVRVTRSSVGAWEVFVDPAGGSDFVTQATGTDNTYSASSHFGVRCVYPDTNRDKFFFDDFTITTTQAPDVTAPTVSSVTPVNSTEIKINFSEALDATNALTADQFALNDTLVATTASFEESNTKIKLTFAQPMVNGRIQKIQFPSVSDPSGNTLSSGSQNFLFFEPVESQLHDIVINEIYADPSPTIGLPEFEFIEIYNRSLHPFQLENWQLTDGTTTATLTAKILLPGEFLTIAPNAAAAAYSGLGPTMSVTTFPSLNNSGDHLQLKNPVGAVIDEQSYTTAWYHDEDKDAGGFSLELIDPTNFCRGADNWHASSHFIGGTPGHQNSVFQITVDVVGPTLLEVVPKSSNVITLKFNERLNSILPALENFVFPYPVVMASASFSNTSNSEIDLAFVSDLDSTLTYTLTANGILDCPGNAIQSEFSSATFKMDIVRPEISSLTVSNQQQIVIVFSETILAESLTNDAIVPDEASGAFAVTQSADGKSVTLDFSTPLINGKDYTIVTRQLTDKAGNEMNDDSRLFRFFQAEPAISKDIVINEIFADQSPAVGLPEGEFIELYNRSSKAFNLSGWTITDGSSVGTLPDRIILPGQYFILCPVTLAAAYSPLGATVGLTSFPSLNNSGDQVKLKDVSGVTIDSIHYSSGWYQNDEKEDGGWTLERINPNDFCGEIENWRASENGAGGTPGKVNSVLSITQDVVAPDLLSVSVFRQDSLVINFSERLSESALAQKNFVFEPQLNPDTIFFTGTDKRQIGFKLHDPLDSIAYYQLIAENIFDCPGNNLPADSATLYFKLDNTLPFVTKTLTLNQSTVLVKFSEKIKSTAIRNENFSLNGQSPDLLNVTDAFSVELIFSPVLANGKKYKMLVKGVSDLAGNTMTQSTHEVLYFLPHPVNRKDLIISEIFADPSPVVGLPETEFIEIYNRSNNPVQLKNWILADEGHEVRLNDHIILPGEYLVLTISAKAFQFGNSLGVSSFPGLTNAGESLVLKDSLRNTIDSVFYSDDWYSDSEKADGGWSLEIIDPENVCSEGENWTAATHDSGGTPGRTNSVDAEKPDLTAPEIISVFALASDTIVVEFNEKLNKQLPSIEGITTSPPLIIRSVSFQDESKRSFSIILETKVEKRIRYRLNILNASDCAGNAYVAEKELFFAQAEKAEAGDIVVNEILFNPRPTGIDFVELFNRSEKFINLKNWASANSVNDILVNKKTISVADLVFEPGEFIVLTGDPDVVKGEFLQSPEEKFLKTALPTLSDEEGSFVLLNEMELIVDTLFYTDDQHSPFLKNKEGVSLERIDSDSPASNKANWQSASFASGYGSPGLPNSNALQNILDGAVSIYPEIFSVASGSPDFTMISYDVEHSGYVANIKIINQQGRVVKTVAENELLGLNGFFTWRGETNQGEKAAIGPYMVWFEMFDESGNVVTVRKRVVVAARF